MFIRRAVDADLASILAIIRQAREYLAAQGLPQWQGGHGPDRAAVERDLADGEGYVLVTEGAICGYAALTSAPDENYAGITEGQWAEGEDRYASIHRVAIAPTLRGKGLSKQFLHDLVTAAGVLGYRDIRIDTHPQNQIMEKVIFHTGFAYKGMIRLPIPHGERRAYQLLLD